MIDLEFRAPPSVVKSYGAAIRNAVSRNRSGVTPTTARARLEPFAANRERVHDYNALCGFESGSGLALTYPHVMAFGLQMAVMTDHEFPLSILGLIHTRNRICRYRPIAVDERLAFTVRIDNWRQLDGDHKFDIDTKAYAAGDELVWTERSTMRSVSRSRSRRSGPDEAPPECEFERLSDWLMPPNLGRRYARLSGDYNPIHLGVLSARLFGFKRAIATGMWLQARAAAALEAKYDANHGYDAVQTTIAFKKPVPLPARREFVVDDSSAEGVAFGLIEREAGTLHVRGTHAPWDPAQADSIEETDNADS